MAEPEHESPSESEEERFYDFADPLEAKNAGNEHFRNGRLEESINCYTQSWELAQTWEPPISVEDKAVIICNRAASYLLLKNFDKAELDATSAIEGYLRRAACYEHKEQYKKALDALELEPDISLAKARVPILEKKASEQQQKEMQEMMGKLKDLGNTILGKFGMSTDDFQAVKDPTTGSYSISMNKKT